MSQLRVAGTQAGGQVVVMENEAWRVIRLSDAITIQSPAWCAKWLATALIRSKHPEKAGPSPRLEANAATQPTVPPPKISDPVADELPHTYAYRSSQPEGGPENRCRMLD